MVIGNRFSEISIIDQNQLLKSASFLSPKLEKKVCFVGIIVMTVCLKWRAERIGLLGLGN